MPRSTIRRPLAVLAVAVVLGAAGCGVSATDDAAGLQTGNGGSPATQAPAVGSFEGTGGAVSLRKAASATSEVTTQKVSMTTSLDGIPVIGGMEVRADGEFDNAAEQGHLTMDMGDLFGSAGGAGGVLPADAGVMEMVIDGDTVYLKSSLFESLSSSGKPWQKASAADLDAQGTFSGGAQTDPGKFLDFLEGAGDEVTEVGQEAVRGVETTHVKTTLDLAKLLEQSEGADRDALEEQLNGLGDDASALREIPAEAWIDGDGYVRKFTMTFDFSGLGSGSSELDGAAMTVTIELYDFNEPVDIAIPPASQVGELDLSVLGD